MDGFPDERVHRYNAGGLAGLVGAKYGLSRLGLCSDEVRLPLTGLLDSTKARIDAAMRHAGLVN